MNIPITTTATGCLHAAITNRGPGRPLDLRKPFSAVRRGIDRKIAVLKRKRARLDREIRRYAELAASLAH